jgi:hypothetical protein
MKRFLIFAVAIAFLVALASYTPTAAQGSIKYGDTVKGSLTGAATSAVSYTFEAKRGDIAVVQLIAAANDGAIGAVLKVLDGNGAVLADSSALLVFGRLGEIVAIEVASDGQYTISVDGGRSGTTGNFEVVLLQAEFLEPNKPVEGTASSTPDGQRGRYTNFYVVESRNETQLLYERLSGNYAPAVIVLGVEAGNNLFERIFMGGSLLTKGSLTLEGSRDFRLVTVGTLGFGSSGRGTAQTANFRLILGGTN